jgi:hypothetical protein
VRGRVSGGVREDQQARKEVKPCKQQHTPTYTHRIKNTF